MKASKRETQLRDAFNDGLVDGLNKLAEGTNAVPGTGTGPLVSAVKDTGKQIIGDPDVRKGLGQAGSIAANSALSGAKNLFNKYKGKSTSMPKATSGSNFNAGLDEK